MAQHGWNALLQGGPGFRGEGKFPIDAYSEFMPPVRHGPKPYGTSDLGPHEKGDPFGWYVTEYEEAFGIRPGLESVARQIVTAMAHLAHGDAAHGIARNKLTDNPYWPNELEDKARKLKHERFVLLMPLALSLTQDDKGRLRWTLFGGSEQGPARAFWRGFYTSPKHELPADQGLRFFRRLLASAYGVPADQLADLHAAGLRILPLERRPDFPCCKEGPLPSWTKPLLWSPRQSLRGVQYLLTFRPFDHLPIAVKRAYLQGELHLLPFPGSLLFWGVPNYLKLQRELPLAMQIPLLHSLHRHEAPFGLRVPQSGWFFETDDHEQPSGDEHGHLRNTYKRTHRNSKVRRDEDELAQTQREDKLVHVLFSADSKDMGLYGKPMARNVQLWNEDFHLLLDGPQAGDEEIRKAAHEVRQGGYFGYRIQWPAMRVGGHELYWQRPLVAFLSTQTGLPAVLPDAPLGYLTAYPADRPDPARAVEMWPRLRQREPHLAAVELFEHCQERHPHVTTRNIRKLLEARDVLGGDRIPASFARRLLALPKHESLECWLEALPERVNDVARCRRLIEELRRGIDFEDAQAGRALTYHLTARRGFEVSYWKCIADLAEGKYRNKNNADVVQDPATLQVLRHHHRDLEVLGDYLVHYYDRQIADAKMTGKAEAGELAFRWQTSFDYDWMGGWVNNQEEKTHERDLIVVIPGKDRRRAVIFADHYDTAYMLDSYDADYGGTGAHVAAAGADDNHSATATLMLSAPIFLDMSRRGRLACDVWLIHLTGEEFPADCLGARHLTQGLIERSLKMRLPDGGERSVGNVHIEGVFVMDMIAHNNDHDRDVFQFAPGTCHKSLRLAYQGHIANELWNRSAPTWNQRSSRRGKGRCHRSARGDRIPAISEHPQLAGEVRVAHDPRSTLYNTDGQIFSDAGLPVVLLMENYDINRNGYHDSHDTMENIDLDYGAGVAAIAIETVARVATGAGVSTKRG
jgi:hypothetical protein